MYQYMKNILLVVFVFIATSCNQDPEAIKYGSDNCSFCKMTIMDEKFSAECLSKKGKIFKFDDIHCLKLFLKNGGVWSNEIAKIYISDFNSKGQWIEAEKAFLLHSEELRSPMGGNYAAFSSEEQRETANKQYNGKKVTWEEYNSAK